MALGVTITLKQQKKYYPIESYWECLCCDCVYLKYENLDVNKNQVKSEPLRVIVGLIKVMTDLSNSCLHFQGSYFQEGMCVRFRFWSSGTRLPYGRRIIYLEYSSLWDPKLRLDLVLWLSIMISFGMRSMRTGFTPCGISWSRDITGDCWGKNNDMRKVIVSSLSWMILAIDDEGKVPLVLALNYGWL